MSKDQHLVVAEIDSSGDWVNVEFKYNPQFVLKVKKVPSARPNSPTARKRGAPFWRVDLDLNTMRRLREVFGDDLGLGAELKAWGKGEVTKEKSLSDLSSADDADLDRVPKTFKWNGSGGTKKKALRPYQRADIKFMASTPVINANQPGAGKTSETILALFEADLEGKSHLVFAPIPSLENVWGHEIREIYAAWNKLNPKQRPKGWKKVEPTILTGSNPKERREAITEAKKLADKGEQVWLILNPAMARLKRQKVEGTKGDSIEYEEVLVSPELIEIDWSSITIDEFHLMGLSNPTTLGARGVNQIAEATQPDKRFALSGTPMGGKPIKLWGALHFLEPGKFTARWNWARHWLVINSNGYGHQIEGIMPGREVDFYEHLKPYLVRRTKQEALPGLPPKQRIDVWCEMTPKQKEQYVTFATEAEWRMEDAEEEGRLTATNILAEYMRLKQFASAYCEVHKTGRENNGIDELEVIPTSESGKLEQLIEKLEEENVIVKSEDDDDPKCALVFSQFNGMVKMIAAVLREKGVPVAEIRGGISDKNRMAAAKAFTDQTEGAPRVLVMNTMAGTSLNLSEADTVHMLDETWVPDNQEQAEDRAHRGDEKTMAKDEVRVYFYRTRNSIEEYIRQLVADKQMNNRTILDLRRRMQKTLKQEEEKASV